MPIHRRYEDQYGFFAKLRWILNQPLLASILTPLVIIFIAWLFGFFQSIPSTYAKQTELQRIDNKYDIEYKRLDALKVDKTVYEQATQQLRSDMKDDWKEFKDDIKRDNKETRDIVNKIWIAQQLQYKKENKSTNMKSE